MKTFRIAICDDEKEIGALIERYLEKYMKENQFRYEIDVFCNGQSLCKELMNNEYDMLFLDIELPDKTGIEIGHYIREVMHNEILQIIYISAKDSYALQLFEYRPMNFLQKPICYEAIAKIIEKYLKIIQYNDELFVYKKRSDIYKVKMSDILYFESHKRKVTITTKHGSDEFYDSLEAIYSKLRRKNFWFIHKSVIVNYRYIKEVYGDAVVMTDQTRFSISQSKRKEIKVLHMQILEDEL